jgi:hypothetical protein
LQAIPRVASTAFIDEGMVARAHLRGELQVQWDRRAHIHKLAGLALPKFRYSPSQHDQVIDTTSPMRIPG